MGYQKMITVLFKQNIFDENYAAIFVIHDRYDALPFGKQRG
jgi:hypothetical protein